MIAAPKLTPGSFPWLLDHDLRLSRRRFASMFAGMSTIVKVVMALHAIIIFHVLAWPVARWIGVLETADNPAGFLLLMAGGILFYNFTNQ